MDDPAEHMDSVGNMDLVVDNMDLGHNMEQAPADSMNRGRNMEPVHSHR